MPCYNHHNSWMLIQEQQYCDITVLSTCHLLQAEFFYAPFPLLKPSPLLNLSLMIYKKGSDACPEQQVSSRTVGWYKKSEMGHPVEAMGVRRSWVSDTWSLFSLKAVSETSPGWAQLPEEQKALCCAVEGEKDPNCWAVPRSLVAGCGSRGKSLSRIMGLWWKEI